MNKQIEEMAKIIHNVCAEGDCLSCEHNEFKHDEYLCFDFMMAKTLVEAGYRKTSEVALEVLDELNRRFMEIHSEGNCGMIRAISEAYVELKKKYEVEE